MDREELRNVARQAIVSHAPEMTAQAVDALLSSGPFQRWLARIAKNRPHGIVAFFRKLRGKQVGLSPAEQSDLKRLVQEQVDRLR